ncbi:isomerase [Pseudorhodobacter sp. E13]|uniref:hydroxypyruvate isomerase family protein n=1 Tax=Pseudorhodobacter sp. E13 TaxID=2487931 RepID=UPI000F8EDA28|nr:TIM barrel protein [Pseudorhodobacter sp. E13]RUS63206.1 isomerase [Pseudorhodobacter sp. E13]
MRFSANLGFLWADLPLPDAIHAAKAAGFDAVECHWPYDTPAADVARALAETGLPMLGLNTRRGDLTARENGLSALPGREADARAAIDEGLAYAVAIKAKNLHVMAGFAAGEAAQASFLANLGYACAQAAPHGITILIEPLNHYDAPGYFLRSTTQAKSIIKAIAAPNLRLMFDCYHVQLMEGDLTHRLHDLRPLIGHIQFASVPDRGAPDHGEVNYPHIFAEIEKMGWAAPLGAEYKPGGPTEETLGWLVRARGQRRD